MHEISRSPRSGLVRIVDFLLTRRHDALVLHLAFALFVALSLFQSLHHIPWRDEAQAWLMARDLSPTGLFLEARHDGHPILWHLMLKALQTAGINYVGMMLLNCAFISGAVWLLFYRSALPLLARLAFALCPACLIHVSYYARDYAVSAFLFFLAATLYRATPQRPLLFTILLALAANTNLYAAAVFAGAGFQFLLEQGCDFGNRAFSVRPIYTRYLAPNLVLVFAAILLVIQLVPIASLFPPPRAESLPADIAAAQSTAALSPAARFLYRVEHAAIFKYNPHLWLFLALFPALLLFRKRPGMPRIYGAALTWLIALVPIIFNPASTRHLFVLVAGAFYFLWIYYDDILRAAPEPDARLRLSPAHQIAASAAILLVALSLRCQQENLRPAWIAQGDSTATAQAIISHHLDGPNTILVTTDPNRLTPVLMLLHTIRADHRPAPFPDAPGSFADFYYYRQRRHVPSIEEMKPVILDLARANPTKTILVVSSVDPGTPAPADPELHLIPVYASPPASYTGDDYEAFQVYQLAR